MFRYIMFSISCKALRQTTRVCTTPGLKKAAHHFYRLLQNVLLMSANIIDP